MDRIIFATMKKLTHNSASPKTRMVVNSKIGRQSKTIKFGPVTVEMSEPAKALVKRNVAAGQSAMKRVKGVLLNPGVRVTVIEGVPLYHTDPAHPGHIVRTLDGRVSKGTFVKGKFKPL